MGGKKKEEKKGEGRECCEFINMEVCRYRYWLGREGGGGMVVVVVVVKGLLWRIKSVN